MTTPLLILGTGGSYSNRYHVKGKSLVKQRTAESQGHDPEGESAGGLASWGRLPGREDGVENVVETARRPRDDSFEHQTPVAPATYAQPGTPGAMQKLAMLDAMTHWLRVQDQQLDEQDDMQRQIDRAVAAASKPQPPVRIIRWNGGTLDLPTPSPTPGINTPGTSTPVNLAHDSSATAQADTAPALTNTTTPHPRNPTHDQPQSHPQTDEDRHDDPGLAPEPWLFADHAGAGRRAGRLQSHRLRARRSPHQKGSPRPRQEQSPLFGAVA